MTNFITLSIIIAMACMAVDGKHMQQQTITAHENDIVAKYADMPEQTQVASGLTKDEDRMLSILAKHMNGRAR